MIIPTEDLVVVAVNKKGESFPLKTFPQDSYFSARTHAIYIARLSGKIESEDTIEVREAQSEVPLFRCSFESIMANTHVLKPYYPEED